MSITSHALLLFFANILILSLFVPINHFRSGGKRPVLAIDAQIPFVPAFVFPYLVFSYPWILALNGMYNFRPISEHLQLTVATAIACGIGYASFLFWPTYVRCTYPHGTGLAHRLLQWLHRVDQPNNACPSMHVYMAVLAMYFSWTNSFWINCVVFLLASSVIAATVLIKRHYVLDVLCGILVGLIAIAGSLVFQ